MNFEPPDFTEDVPLIKNRTSGAQQLKFNQDYKLNQDQKFQSPLLQNPANKLDKYPPVPKGAVSQNGNVYNRLGYRNNSYRGNVPNNVNTVRNDGQNDRNFTRKRHADTAGPMMNKRNWGNRSYHQIQQNRQGNNSVQDRINRIRSNNHQPEITKVVETNNRFEITPEVNQEPEEPVLNESQEVDATDITVEVINHNVQSQEDTSFVKFKMILDPKTQAAIKTIQQKRKDKQIIFPFPVTPNVTGLSLHERFGML